MTTTFFAFARHSAQGQTESAKSVTVDDRSFIRVIGLCEKPLMDRRNLQDGFWTNAMRRFSHIRATSGFDTRSWKHKGPVQ